MWKPENTAPASNAASTPRSDWRPIGAEAVRWPGVADLEKLLIGTGDAGVRSC
jgi:hypothetical protein